MWNANLAISAVYRHILTTRCFPDFGLHCVMRIGICGAYRMEHVVVPTSGYLPPVVARTLLQPTLNVATQEAKISTQRRQIWRATTERGKSASKVTTVGAAGATREPIFFLCADAMVQTKCVQELES